VEEQPGQQSAGYQGTSTSMTSTHTCPFTPLVPVCHRPFARPGPGPGSPRPAGAARGRRVRGRRRLVGGRAGDGARPGRDGHGGGRLVIPLAGVREGRLLPSSCVTPGPTTAWGICRLWCQGWARMVQMTILDAKGALGLDLRSSQFETQSVSWTRFPHNLRISQDKTAGSSLDHYHGNRDARCQSGPGKENRKKARSRITFRRISLKARLRSFRGDGDRSPRESNAGQTSRTATP